MAISCHAKLSMGSRPFLLNSAVCLHEQKKFLDTKVYFNSSGKHAAYLSSKQSRSNCGLVKQTSPAIHGAPDAYSLPVTRAQKVEFTSMRKVMIPFSEGSSPAVDYLKEPERVVRVTFPDSTRITYLGDSMWRSRLKPITFITVTATPTTVIRVYHEDGSLRIFSDKLYLDFTGVPDQFKNLYIKFELKGSLKVIAKVSQPGRVNFDGVVSLKVGTDLPLPFSLLPQPLLTGSGDGILNAIIGAMESELVRGIIDDYHCWCRVKQGSEVASARSM